MASNRILICDKIAKDGLELLATVGEVVDRAGISAEDLREEAAKADAIVVRSQTKIRADVIALASNLKVIGRAGVGVDNIDVDAATERGIVVVNSPEGNTRAAAEHAVALLLALTRGVTTGDARIRAREWSRSGLMGNEVRGKVLGLIGMGRVGQEVARMGRGLGMKVLAYDPALSDEQCRRVEVQPSALEDLLRESDFVSVHVPLTENTRGMLSTERLALMKPTARVVNCSRGAVVDEAALAEALKAGRLAGAAIDVFESEPEPPWESPLMDAPNTVLTPHLGASTEEAQSGAALDVATQIVDVLEGRPPTSPVNLPNIPAETFGQLRPWLPLVERMGLLVSHLAGRGLKSVSMTYSGAIAEHDCTLLSRRFLVGLLRRIMTTPVNDVNVALVAKDRGASLTQSKQDRHPIFHSHVRAEVQLEGEVRTVEGSLRGYEQPRIVGLDEYHVDIEPEGAMLVTISPDRPGDFGRIATILGKYAINIRQLSAGRRSDPDDRTSVLLLGLEEAPSDACLAELRAIDPPADYLGIVNMG